MHSNKIINTIKLIRKDDFDKNFQYVWDGLAETHFILRAKKKPTKKELKTITEIYIKVI